MKKINFLPSILTILIYSLIPTTAMSETTIAPPILLDKAALSGLDLKPVTAKWAPKDRELFSKQLYSGKKFDVMVMAGNTAKTQFTNYEFDEFVYVINGQATLTTEDGVAQTFKTGDFFVVPKGFSGEWHSQGNKYYQELIVIMKERSDHDKPTSKTPLLIDKTKFSGLDIERVVWERAPNREVYRENLYDGPELDIAIVAGATATTKMTKPLAEEFVYVVNGTAALTPEGGETKTFYTGDFFVVPEGFVGTWTSTGNHLYRELIALPSNR